MRFLVFVGSQTASNHRCVHRSGARLCGGRKLSVDSADCAAIWSARGSGPASDHRSTNRSGARSRGGLGSSGRSGLLRTSGASVEARPLPTTGRPTEAERGRAVVMVAPDCPDFRVERGSRTASDHGSTNRSGARSRGGHGSSGLSARAWKPDRFRPQVDCHRWQSTFGRKSLPIIGSDFRPSGATSDHRERLPTSGKVVSWSAARLWSEAACSWSEAGNLSQLKLPASDHRSNLS